MGQLVERHLDFFATPMKIFLAQFFVLVMLGVVSAQTRGDVCHVYVVDAAKARKAFADFHETGNPNVDAKALSVGVTTFPEFRTVSGEEELTTKTYKFPGSKLIITASVYYTDESMASSQTNDSMTLGIKVDRKGVADATDGENNAMAEVTDDDGTNTVRAKKYLRVNGRLYLVGIECHCKQKPPQ